MLRTLLPDLPPTSCNHRYQNFSLKKQKWPTSPLYSGQKSNLCIQPSQSALRYFKNQKSGNTQNLMKISERLKKQMGKTT